MARSRLGSYKLKKLVDKPRQASLPGKVLGQGAKGMVFLVEYDGKPAALKKITLDSKDPVQCCLANSEINIMQQLGKLNAPHVVTYYDSDISDPTCYHILMEYMNMGTLLDFIQQNQESVGWPMQEWIVGTCAYALAFMHNHNILHNDLKSANVLVSEKDGRINIKLGDFGFACLEKSTIAYHGSPLWLAPELLTAKTKNTKATDIYSFGILTWEIVDWSGNTPYSHLNPPLSTIRSLRKIVNEEQQRPLIREDCPLDLKEVMIGCWQHEPEKRLQAHQLFPTLFKPTRVQRILEESVEKVGNTTESAEEADKDWQRFLF